MLRANLVGQLHPCRPSKRAYATLKLKHYFLRSARSVISAPFLAYANLWLDAWWYAFSVCLFHVRPLYAPPALCVLCVHSVCSLKVHGSSVCAFSVPTLCSFYVFLLCSPPVMSVSGPSLNILVKLMAMVSLLMAPLIGGKSDWEDWWIGIFPIAIGIVATFVLMYCKILTWQDPLSKHQEEGQQPENGRVEVQLQEHDDAPTTAAVEFQKMEMQT